jgi:hypothetical protein
VSIDFNQWGGDAPHADYPTLATFLHDLFRDCLGLIELRHVPSKDQSFHEGPAAAAKEAARLDQRGGAVYFGVATRDGKGGKKANIVAFPGVWCDVDFKNTPKEMAENLLRDFPLTPTFIIASGGGLHLYWKFKEAVGKEEIVKIEAILRGIARILQGDKSSAEAAHVLRPVGMFNRKYDPPRRVEVIESNPEVLYNLSDFDLYADAELPKTTTTPSTGTLLSADLLPTVVKQCAAISGIFSRAKQERHLGHGERIAVANLYSVFDGGREKAMELFSTLSDYDAAYTSAQMSSLVGKPPLCSNEALCGGNEKCVAIQKAGGASPIKLATWREEKKGPEIMCLETLRPRTATDLLLDTTPPPPSIVDKILLAATVLMIVGVPKVGKTWLALLLALCISSGKPFLGFEVPGRRRCLYLGGEGSDANLKKRLQAATAFFPGLEDKDLDNFLVLSTLGHVKYDDSAGAEAITRWADDADVVFFDPAFRFQAHGSENSHADARAVQDFLDGLKAAGKSVVVVHHLRKPGQIDSGISEIRGAGWDAFTDSALRLDRKRAESSERFNLKFDLRHDEPLDDMELVRVGPLFVPAEPTIRKATPQDVARFIHEAGGRVEGRQAIVEGVGRATAAGSATIRMAIATAEKDGLIFSVKRAGTRGQGRAYLLKDGADFCQMISAGISADLGQTGSEN